MRYAFRPWEMMEEMRREMDRVFRSLAEGRLRISPVSFLPGLAARAYPLVNVSEDKDNVYVEALAPGLSPDSLKVVVVQDQLQISGEKEGPRDVKPEAYHRSERAAGRFVRSISLPVEVEDGKVSAEYRNGILEITLPKAEKARPKEIAVKVA
ncbi:Hsp20/alpha crystallin family protein [bacterium]|nr:Hsp20/alpha crystallin family protein [bacterium]